LSSLKRREQSSNFLLALASVVILGSEFRGTHDQILLPQIRGSPNLEVQVAVFISPRNRRAQLYPQVLGSHFVASYDLQGYDGSIRTLLHMGVRGVKIIQLIYKNPVLTSQETYYVSAKKLNRLILFGETVTVHCENQTEHINTVCGQDAEILYIRILSVPHRKHHVSAMKPNRLTLFREISLYYSFVTVSTQHI
jgi:hypothetical protein